MLWDYGADVTDSLSGLTKILESRFGGKAIADKHRIELRNRRRRKDETLQSLHSDIRRLAALAYPEVQPQTRDVITGDYFLDALGDPDLALKVRERRPEDLDTALRIALQLEAWEADTARRKEVPQPEKEGKRIRGISNKRPDPAVEVLQEEVERMTKLMEALQKEVGRMKKLIEFERGTPRRSLDKGGFARYNRQPNLSSTPVGFQIRSGIPHRILMVGQGRRMAAFH